MQSIIESLKAAPSSGSHAKAKAAPKAALGSHEHLATLSRLVLSHEHAINTLEASCSLTLALHNEEAKQAVHRQRLDWDKLHKGSKNPTPSKRCLTHALLLQRVADLKLPPSGEDLSKQLVSFTAAWTDEAVVKLQPKHPAPMVGKIWSFTLMTSPSSNGQVVMNSWRAMMDLGKLELTVPISVSVSGVSQGRLARELRAKLPAPQRGTKRDGSSS